jgi:hypothetical protein
MVVAHYDDGAQSDALAQDSPEQPPARIIFTGGFGNAPGKDGETDAHANHWCEAHRSRKSDRAPGRQPSVTSPSGRPVLSRYTVRLRHLDAAT